MYRLYKLKRSEIIQRYKQYTLGLQLVIVQGNTIMSNCPSDQYINSRQLKHQFTYNKNVIVARKKSIPKR